jgi:hypothetical protein
MFSSFLSSERKGAQVARIADAQYVKRPLLFWSCGSPLSGLWIVQKKGNASENVKT